MMKEHKRTVLSGVILLVIAGGVTALTIQSSGCAQVSSTATPRPHAMIFVGDSIMQDSATAAPHTVVSRLRELRPYWRIRNYSIAGATVSGCPTFPTMSANDIVPLHGNPVVIFLGTNDFGCGVPIARFRIDYSSLVHTLNPAHPQIICVTPIWRAGDGSLNNAGLKLDDYRNAITQICTADGHPVIDGLSLVPHDPKDYADGVHPNDAGYSYYAQNLAEALDKFVSH